MPRKSTPLLSEALAQYLAIRGAHVAKTTLENDKSVLGRFVQDVGDPPVHLLDDVTVETFFAQVSAQQKPNSYNKVRTRVQGFMSFCLRRGWLDVDPMLEVRTRRVIQRERMKLSTEQMRNLIETTANPRDRGMLAMGCNVGLRASDICKMKVGDVDLDQGYLHVVIQKTGMADALPISLELDQELRRWLSWYTTRLSYIGEALKDDMVLFPAMGYRNVYRNGEKQFYGDPRPYSPLVHSSVVVHKALKRIGIEATLNEGFHTLRRSVGRTVFERASAQGHDSALRIAAAVLGHKNVATTELYLGISHDRVKRDELMKGQSLLGAPAEVIPLISPADRATSA